MKKKKKTISHTHLWFEYFYWTFLISPNSQKRSLFFFQDFLRFAIENCKCRLFLNVQPLLNWMQRLNLRINVSVLVYLLSYSYKIRLCLNVTTRHAQTLWTLSQVGALLPGDLTKIVGSGITFHQHFSLSLSFSRFVSQSFQTLRHN